MKRRLVRPTYREATTVIAETFLDRKFTSAERFNLARRLVDKMNESDKLRLSVYATGKALNEIQ